jgi:hypothetical protein
MAAPIETPKACYKLMLNCWSENPSARYNFDEIVDRLQSVIKNIKSHTL